MALNTQLLECRTAPFALLQVRGTDMVSPHGVPVDLLDRLVIIRTQVG